MAGPLVAHDIITTKLTYTRDISRIFARRCVSCHGKGSKVSLTTYEEVRPWAVAIKEQVIARTMPPWGALKGFRDLEPDDALTEAEIQIISAWVVGGAPRGDVALLPEHGPKAPPHRKSELHDAVTVPTRVVLKRSLTVAGIRPQPENLIESTRITAHLPNGRVEPLLWLFRYDPKWNRVFRFRRPLTLPRGTVIEASAPLQYSLESPAKAP